jgi:opacity protein-like surface antigen
MNSSRRWAQLVVALDCCLLLLGIGATVAVLSVSAVRAETRLTLGVGATNYIPTTTDGTWIQKDQKHGFDTLSLGLKAGLEQTLSEHWYIGAGYVSLGTSQAWTEAKSDDEFFQGKHGKADKYLNATDRMQGGELYVGYQWQVEAFRPYLTAGVAQFWHRVTQTHDTATQSGTVRAQDMTWHGTVRSWRVGGGLCYRWLCGEVTYYRGATPGTNYPIATDALVPMLTLTIPLDGLGWAL